MELSSVVDLEKNAKIRTDDGSQRGALGARTGGDTSMLSFAARHGQNNRADNGSRSSHSLARADHNEKYAVGRESYGRG